jgi:hypothetical protein
MSLYADGTFLDDAKLMVDEFGVSGSANAGAITFQCLISDPMVTQSFQEGGFVDRTQHSVRIPAATASWSLPDGSNGASAAIVVSQEPIASLGIGKVIAVDGKSLRIVSQSHKRPSAWVTLQVILLNQ